MNKLYFYTGNENKLKELSSEFKNNNINYNIIMQNVDIPEIQSVLNEEVIKHKLNYVKSNFMTNGDLYTKSFIVEDTGLYIDNMNSFPGALIKSYLNYLQPNGISKFNGGSNAQAETWIGLWDNNTQQEYYFVGKVKGIISKNPLGTNGFGYDSIFSPFIINEYQTQTENNNLYHSIINDDCKTYAQFNDIEKAMCNMRTIAGYKLGQHIKNYI